MITSLTVFLIFALAAANLGWAWLFSATTIPPDDSLVVCAFAAAVTIMMALILVLLEVLTQQPLLLVSAFYSSPLALNLCILLVLRAIQPSTPNIDMTLAYLVLGAAGGFLYSSLAAYRNTGLPYQRIVQWLGILAAAVAMAAEAVLLLLLPTSFTLAMTAARIVLAGVVGSLGFLLLALRPEDWLVSWTLLRMTPAQAPVTHIARVTVLPLGELQYRLERWAGDNWQVGLNTASEIWIYTRQRRVVVRALYHVLLEVSHREYARLPMHVTALVEMQRPWEPHLFLDGGERSNRRLLGRIFSPEDNHTLLTYSETNPVNMGLAAEEYCKQELFAEARSRLIRTAGTGGEIDIIAQSFDALQTYLDITAPSQLENLPPPTRRGTNTNQRGVFTVLPQLHEILTYLWLARRCWNTNTQGTALQTAQTQLLALENWIQQNGQLTVCENRILTRIVANWRTDALGLGNLPAISVNVAACVRAAGNPFTYDGPLWRPELMLGCDGARAALTEALSGDRLQICEVRGPILCGKTSLLNTTLSPEIEARRVEFASVKVGHINTQVAAIRGLALALYDELVLIQRYDYWTEEKLLIDPLRVLEQMIRAICAADRTGRRLIIAIDDIERIDMLLAEHDELDHFLAFLFHLAEQIPNLGIVLLYTVDYGHNYESFRSSISRLANPSEVTFLDTTRNRVIAEFLQHPVPGFCYRFAEKAVDRVVLLTGGQPYFVQLLASGVVQQFARNQNSAGAGPRRSASGFFYDPLFTDTDVDDAARSEPVRQGLRYYMHRMKQHFANSDPDTWPHISFILQQYYSDWNAALRPRDLAALFPRSSIPIDPSYVGALMDRLEKQGILEGSGPDEYSLQVKILGYR